MNSIVDEDKGTEMPEEEKRKILGAIMSEIKNRNDDGDVVAGQDSDYDEGNNKGSSSKSSDPGLTVISGTRSAGKGNSTENGDVPIIVLLLPPEEESFDEPTSSTTASPVERRRRRKGKRT